MRNTWAQRVSIIVVAVLLLSSAAVSGAAEVDTTGLGNDGVAIPDEIADRFS